MPYQSDEYNSPPLPEVKQIRTFEDVRSAVGLVLDYLQRVQAAQVQYFQHLRSNLNESATTQGPDLAAAATIEPTNFMHIITGSATITNIIAPRFFAGHLMLFAQDGFTLARGGNISLITDPNVLAPGSHISFTYVPSKQIWYTDSCRLANGTTSLMIGGRTVVTQ